ncbi:MAG: nucleoside recognition domain-containing protein, partial [Candidatus Omnitrophota bacterium]
IRGILIHTWERLKTFIIRAGKAIVFVVVLLSFLNSFGTDGSFGNQDSEHSVLSAIGKTLVPVFKPMGLRDENWPAAVGVFTGIFAKETVIGTLDALYSRSDTVGIDSEKDGEAFSLTKRIQNAFRTIPENLSHLSLPFSIRGLIGADVETAVNELEVTDSMYEILRKQFDGRVGAFAYLLMILLYMPCVASIAAVYRELNIQWTLFSVFYLSGLAWIVSTLFYQVMRFGQHPVSSFEWIVLICLIFAGFISVLKRKGKRGRYAH